MKQGQEAPETHRIHRTPLPQVTKDTEIAGRGDSLAS